MRGGGEMKDKNGIEIKCKNCANYGTYLFMPCLLYLQKNAGFKPTVESYEARIAELQKELTVVQEADRLRAEVKDLGKKLTETVKLLSERSRECGELEAHNEVLQRRVQEARGKMNPFAENVTAWIEENQNQDLSKFLSNLDICCYSTKYNEDIICIQPNGENGWNFEIAQLFSNLNRTLAQYNRTKGFTRGFLERVELLFKLHKGQTNEQLKHILRTESEER